MARARDRKWTPHVRNRQNDTYQKKNHIKTGTRYSREIEWIA